VRAPAALNRKPIHHPEKRFMKRHGGLWESLLGWDNLLLAARKAQRGKRSRHAVQSFNFTQESQLLRLKDELESGAYAPGPFHTHRITRPKSRLISAAPYRDRVVHHAIMNVLEPILDRRFHPHSYACRKGKGTHAASDRLQDLMRRRKFALQCDVRKFFPSIDHEILKSTFRRVVKDSRLLALMDRVVDASNAQDAVLDWFPGDTLFSPLERRRGLPIGNGRYDGVKRQSHAGGVHRKLFWFFACFLTTCLAYST
jgi:RNA-directed DNA polymerase